MEDIPRNAWYRFFEIFPGALSWLIIVIPFVASFHFPQAVAIFITLYVLLWFLRSLKLSVFLIAAYFRNKQFQKQNWHIVLQFFSDNPPSQASKHMERVIVDRIMKLRSYGRFKKWNDIYHVVIIATFKEEKEILDSSFEALQESDFPLKRIIVVLASEERDAERAKENARYLEKKFGGVFAEFHHSVHPAHISGEVQGKGPNITHAGEMIAKKLIAKGIDPSNVLVTTLDADNRPHPSYFSNLTYHYLMEPDREKKSYQPLPFFYNNIWDVPLWNRIIAITSSFWHLTQSAQFSYLRNFSSHAQSLETLLKTNFWSKQTIVEDGHQFWRSFFALNGDHEVIPLFIPIYQDAVQNKTYFSTLKGQYVQLRRWAWGASDIPFVVLKMWKHRKKLPPGKSFALLFQLIEGHVMWATAPIVVALTNSVPFMLNKEFSQSIFAHNLNYLFSLYFTIAISGILVSLWISLLMLPPHPRGTRWFLFSMFQWIFLPVVTILFGAIPAIEAQTRLMLGRPLAFSVTEKVRKQIIS